MKGDEKVKWGAGLWSRHFSTKFFIASAISAQKLHSTSCAICQTPQKTHSEHGTTDYLKALRGQQIASNAQPPNSHSFPPSHQPPLQPNLNFTASDALAPNKTESSHDSS